jgi:hypothetical protein
VRALLHLNFHAVVDAVHFWGVVGLAALTHARFGRCPICHTALRLDDRLAVRRYGLVHLECARYRMLRPTCRREVDWPAPSGSSPGRPG